jgi:hypothetical protein
VTNGGDTPHPWMTICGGVPRDGWVHVCAVTAQQFVIEANTDWFLAHLKWHLNKFFKIVGPVIPIIITSLELIWSPDFF